MLITYWRAFEMAREYARLTDRDANLIAVWVFQDYWLSSYRARQAVRAGLVDAVNDERAKQ